MRFLPPILLAMIAFMIFVLASGPMMAFGPGLAMLFWLVVAAAVTALVVALRQRLPEGGDAAVELELREIQKRLQAVEERLGLSEDELADVIRKIDAMESAAAFDQELGRGSVRRELPSSDE
jgi:low affinity Fe/Cu permease